MSTVYTYRNGAKLPLSKDEASFVIRATGQDLSPLGLGQGQQTSTASTRLQVASGQLEEKMRAARGLAPTHHSYRVEGDGSEFLITDRVYLRLNKAYQGKVQSVAADHGLLLVDTLGDNEYILQLTESTGMNPVKLVVKLVEQDERVELAENDLNYTVQVTQVITDGAYEDQWHLHGRSDSPEVREAASSRCEQAWAQLQSFGSPSVVIAVTDDGCRLDHRDFNSPGKFAAWGYFEGSELITNQHPQADPNKMYEPGANHGTACAAVAAAEIDGELTVGAAPGCRLLPIKWPSQGPSLFIGDRRLRKAIDFLADKADIMSNSWGNPINGDVGSMVRDRIASLSQSGGRRGKGIVFLWAAGNENCPIHHETQTDTPFTNGIEFEGNRALWAGVHTSRSFRHNLSELPGVMYIGALASNGQRSHYSNYGKGLGLCAPSNNVHTYRRLQVPGEGVTTALGESSRGIRDSFGGTSSATPLVAGIAGLVISARPELEALEVISTLKQTAHRTLNEEGYPQTPPASFDQDTSWDVSPIAPFDAGHFRDIGSPDGTWSPWFGFGKVDAAAAVESVIVGQSQTFEASNNQRVEIADFSLRGARSEIEVRENGHIEDLVVDLRIHHTYRGDLFVHLESPDRTIVALHRRRGGGADDLIRSYTLADTPALRRIVGHQAQGTWTLVAYDLARVDTGSIHSWTLRGNLRPS